MEEVTQEQMAELHEMCIAVTQGKSTDDVAKAEEAMRIAEKAHPVVFYSTLVALIASPESHKFVKMYAAVHIRKFLVRGEDDALAFFSPQEQDSLKAGLRMSLVENLDVDVLTQLCECVAVVAQALLNADRWDDLIPFLFQLAQAERPEHRVASLHIFGLLTERAIDSLNAHASNLYSMIAALLDDSELGVRVRAVHTACKIVAAEHEPAIFHEYQAMMGKYFEVLTLCLEQGEGDHARRILAAFVDLVSEASEADFFKHHLKPLRELMGTIAVGQELPEGIRHFALELLISIAMHGNFVQLKKNIPFFTACTSICLEMTSQVPDDEEWGVEYAQSFDEMEASATSSAGEAAMMRLFMSSSVYRVRDKALPVVVKMIRSHLTSHDVMMRTQKAGGDRGSSTSSGNNNTRYDWRTGFAALKALGSMGKRIPLRRYPIREIIACTQESHHPRVRATALATLESLSANFSPRFQEQCHALVIPAILSGLRDRGHARVQYAACSLLFNFAEQCEEGVLASKVEELLQELSILLSEGEMEVQKSVLSAIGGIAAGAPEQFKEYYASVMPSIKAIILQPENDAQLELRPSALEAFTFIGLQVGEIFHPDADEIVQAFAQRRDLLQGYNCRFDKHNGEEDDDENANSEIFFLQAMGRLAIVLKKSFAPCVPMILPTLMRQAAYVPKLLRNRTRASVKFSENPTDEEVDRATGADRLENKSNGGGGGDDDGGYDEDENDQQRHVRSEARLNEDNPVLAMQKEREQMYVLLDDKATAISIISSLALYLEELFYPYVQETFTTLRGVVSFENSEVFKLGASLLPDLVKSVVYAFLKGREGANLPFEPPSLQDVRDLTLTVVEQLGQALTVTDQSKRLLLLLDSMANAIMPLGLIENTSVFTSDEVSVIAQDLLDHMKTRLDHSVKYHEACEQLQAKHSAIDKLASHHFGGADADDDDDDDDDGDGEEEGDDESKQQSHRRGGASGDGGDDEADFTVVANLNGYMDQLEKARKVADQCYETLSVVAQIFGELVLPVIEANMKFLLAMAEPTVPPAMRRLPLCVFYTVIMNCKEACAPLLGPMVETALARVVEHQAPRVQEHAAYLLACAATFCSKSLSGGDNHSKNVEQVIEALASGLEGARGELQRLVAERERAEEEAKAFREARKKKRAAKKGGVKGKFGSSQPAGGGGGYDDHDDDDDDPDDDELEPDSDDDEEGDLADEDDRDPEVQLEFTVDNIVSALGKVMFYLERWDIYPAWLAELPLTTDIPEYEKALSILWEMLSNDNPHVLGAQLEHLPTIIKVASHGISSESVRPQFKLLMCKLLKGLAGVPGEAMQAAFSSMNEEEQEAVQKVMQDLDGIEAELAKEMEGQE